MVLHNLFVEGSVGSDAHDPRGEQGDLLMPGNAFFGCIRFFLGTNGTPKSFETKIFRDTKNWSLTFSEVKSHNCKIVVGWKVKSGKGGVQRSAATPKKNSNKSSTQPVEAIESSSTNNRKSRTKKQKQHITQKNQYTHFGRSESGKGGFFNGLPPQSSRKSSSSSERSRKQHKQQEKQQKQHKQKQQEQVRGAQTTPKAAETAAKRPEGGWGPEGPERRAGPKGFFVLTLASFRGISLVFSLLFFLGHRLKFKTIGH